MMSSLSGERNDGSDLPICTARLNDAQQLNLMEEGNGSQTNTYGAGAGAHANMDATVRSIDPPMSDSQTIAPVTDDNSGEINSALTPPLSDAETIAAVIDIDARCDEMDEEIKGIAKRASPTEPPLPDNTTAATIVPRIDEEMGTDLAGLDMASGNSGQVNLEGGEHVLDDEESEIANTTVGQTTPRDTVGQTASRSQKRRRGAVVDLCMVRGSDDAQGQGPIQESAATFPPSSPAPQAAGRVEDVSDGATQGPLAESPTRAPSIFTLEPSIPILEAMLVEDEIPTARVECTSVYQATQIPDPLPVPWWKQNQMYLAGVSAAILVALGVALGVVLIRDDSDSNLTYYPDRMNRICSNATSGRDNSSEQILFETAESCCEEIFWDYQDDCLVNSLGTSHHPSSPPSDSPTISDDPSSPLPVASSSSNAPRPVPSQSPSESMSPTLSTSPTYQPSLSMRPTTQLQSSALRLVTSEDVVGGHGSTENVVVQGDTVVIGAPNNDNKRGVAFVLNRDESGWSQLAKLEAPDGEWGDKFGRSVAIDGDIIVVGAHRDDNRKGSIHAFVNINGSWQHQARLVAPDRDADDDDGAFGYSVDIHHDRVVVGAYKEDSNGKDAGAAYVFVQNETKWALESILLAPAGGADDRFGRSVGIFDDAIVVGAPHEDAGAADSGAAHVYSRTSGGSWEHRAMLSSPDGASGDEFGQSVGIHGNHVIVGAPWDDSNGDDAGASFVFADDGSAWTLEAKLLAPDRATNDRFGQSVGIFEDTAVVSSPQDDDNGGDSGSAHVYELAQGAWSCRAKVLAPDGAVGDKFGRSAAVHNGTIIAHSWNGETFAFSD